MLCACLADMIRRHRPLGFPWIRGAHFQQQFFSKSRSSNFQMATSLQAGLRAKGIQTALFPCFDDLPEGSFRLSWLERLLIDDNANDRLHLPEFFKNQLTRSGSKESNPDYPMQALLYDRNRDASCDFGYRHAVRKSTVTTTLSSSTVVSKSLQ